MFLCIIGNGFDKAHNLPTDYRNDLMRILKQKDNEKFQFINNLYFKGDEKLWSHFEDNIGNIKKYDELDQKYTNIVQDFFNEYSNIYQYPAESENYGNDDMEVDNATDAAESHRPRDSDFELDYDFKDFIDEGMEEMIKEANDKIANNQVSKIPNLPLTTSDFYITFNYTNTLEEVYKISSKNILHIHGTLKDMIYGNDVSKLTDVDSGNFNIDFDNYEKDDLNIDSYVTPFTKAFMDAIQYSDSEKEELEKKLSDQLNDQNSLFEKDLQKDKLIKFMNILPKNVDKIIVIGHSLGKIDIPYFETIRKMLPQVHWWISYYKSPNNMSNYKNLSFSNNVTLFKI